MTANGAGIDERTLVRQAARQDEQAWEALVLAHQEAVFRLAYLFTGDPDEAQDVAQETFVRAYHAIQHVDVERPLRPWLLSITANLSRNYLRSLKRSLAALQRFARGEMEERVLAAHDPQGVWEAVRRLALEDQQVLYLRFFLSLAEEETAAVLHLPVGTVKSRQHRALQRLKTIWQADLEDPTPTGQPTKGGSG